MIYLIKTTETYRTSTEEEAKKLIEKAKYEYEVVKSVIENRQQKSKGEIVDEWKRVTITKVFCDEKEPEGRLMPNYTEDSMPSYTEERD